MKKWFSKHDRLLIRCVDCQLIQVPEGITIANQGVSVYEDKNNIFLLDGGKYYYYDETNLLSCRKKLEWVKKYIPKKARLLDVGANLGHFLKTAQDYYNVSGVELSPIAVELSQEHLGVPNQEGSIYDIPENIKGPFDALTCWDVIEHLPDTQTALGKINKVLKPGGYLFLSTPDAGSFTACFLGKYWHYIDTREHLNLFTRKI